MTPTISVQISIRLMQLFYQTPSDRPCMEDCIDSVGPAVFITKLNILKGYRQVPLTPRASDMSSFVTPDHFLQHMVMAFRMRNAPATFQCKMHLVLGNVPHCDVYLEDVVVYSDD